MAKSKVAKAIYNGPVELPARPKQRRAEIEQVKNGFLVSGAYDDKLGACPRYIAVTEKEAKDLASKLL